MNGKLHGQALFATERSPWKHQPKPMSDKKEETVVHCPKCGAKVHVDDKAQKAMSTTCPNGHTVELVKLIE